MSNHDKQRTFIRGWFVGQKMFKAVEALELMESYTTGLRKDNVTPEANHPLSVTLYLLTLKDAFLYPEDTLVTALLHDLCEDYDYSFTSIETQFGRNVSDAVNALTKVYKGIKRDPNEVKMMQSEDPIASIVKGSDRIHNQSTSVGVFSADKMNEYVDETEAFILPMLKTARKTFTEQYTVYTNMQTVLKSQNAFMRALAA